MTGPDTPIKSSRLAVDRMKQLTSDLRRASRMTSFQDFPILALGYSSLVAPINNATEYGFILI